MAKKGKYRTFLISMPTELIPIYDFIQKKLNQFLSNPAFRSKLLALDFSQHRGNVWRDIRDIVGKEELTSWKGEIPNPVWYFYMLCDNLLRIVKSKDAAIACFNTLKNNGNKIDQDLFESLNERGIYPTVGFLRNLKRSDEPPTIAKKATFVMDYSISAEQNCQRIADNIFGFNYESGKYLTYEVVIPLSVRKNLTGRIAKPRFIKRKSDGRYVGHCSYQVGTPTVKCQNILGVDLGKKKLFSSVVLYSDGDYSDEIVNSRLSHWIDEKLKRKLKDLERLLEKNKTLEDLINGDINLFNSHLEEIRQDRVNQIMELRGNISNTKRYIAKLIASEIVSIAKENNCKEIHLENLSWLESKGGRWNHSEIQDFITEFAELEGIKVIKIYAKHTSSAHPITGELGKKRNRNIQFQNGNVMDRDLLASLNIAKRNKKSQKENKVTKLRKTHTSTPKKVKKPSNRKVKTVTVKRDACGDIFLYIVVEQEIEEIKVRSGEIVGFDYGFHYSMLIGVNEDEDIKAPSFFRKNQEKFKQANRVLSLKEGGSNHKRAARLNRAKLYRRIAWQRKDYHYKLAHELCDRYSLICLEDLSHKFMMKGHGKKAGDYGFAAFLKILEWVALKRGVTIVKVDRFFPSSQLCHCCGYQNHEVKDLSIREWDCPECHAHHDRDRNAAMNILKEGLRIAS